MVGAAGRWGEDGVPSARCRWLLGGTREHPLLETMRHRHVMHRAVLVVALTSSCTAQIVKRPRVTAGWCHW